MKLLHLEIHNIRGIKDLNLTPEGNNMVVWGPNGTGKSGVIDAIDFLLTGRITRLTGQGTGNLSLDSHGPHIDQDTQEAYVKASIAIPGQSAPISIKRGMSLPTQLEITGIPDKKLNPIKEIALRGQHILTRREILRYITAESGTRANQIQSILNISEVEKTRQSFVKLCTNADREVKSTNTVLHSLRHNVNATIGQSAYIEEAILKEINNLREFLGGALIHKIHSSDLKSGIKPPSNITEKSHINTFLVETIVRGGSGGNSADFTEPIAEDINFFQV